LKAANYRRNVSEWQKRPKRVVERVLSGVDLRAVIPSFDEMLKYWVPVIEGTDACPPQVPISSPSGVQEHASRRVLSPITATKVFQNLPRPNTAPGPDGFPARLWRRIPVSVIAGLFNLFVASRRLPDALIASRTIFVPKKGDLGCPANYRPISIALIAVRHYHRILAQRMEKMSLVDARQRAFRCADGVGENIFLVDSLLRDARSLCKGLYLAFLDLSKVFDTVFHQSITTAKRGVGLDRRFVDYIRDVYTHCGTFIQAGGQSSWALSVSRGVRQGDPLSPLLFNLVVDTGLRAIPDTIGYSLGGATVNAQAFTGDVILVASTPQGLRSVPQAFTSSRTWAKPIEVCDSDDESVRKRSEAENHRRDLFPPRGRYPGD